MIDTLCSGLFFIWLILNSLYLMADGGYCLFRYATNSWEDDEGCKDKDNFRFSLNPIINKYMSDSSYNRGISDFFMLTLLFICISVIAFLFGLLLIVLFCSCSVIAFGLTILIALIFGSIFSRRYFKLLHKIQEEE